MLPNVDDEAGCIASPARFFSDLGNLHDAKIRLFEWNPDQWKVSFVLDDLYSNFVGLPEYPGVQPIKLILGNVSKLEIEAVADMFPMRVMDFEIKGEVSDSKIHILVSVVPTGLMLIVCESIEWLKQSE